MAPEPREPSVVTAFAEEGLVGALSGGRELESTPAQARADSLPGRRLTAPACVPTLPRKDGLRGDVPEGCREPSSAGCC